MPLPRAGPAYESDAHDERYAACAQRLANQLRAQEGGSRRRPTEGDRQSAFACSAVPCSS